MRWLRLDLDSDGGTAPLGMFPRFLTKTADILAPRLALVFWQLLRLGSFPVCFRVAYASQFQRVHLPTQWLITDQFP